MCWCRVSGLHLALTDCNWCSTSSALLSQKPRLNKALENQLASVIPVVHQDIWLPEVVRRNSDIFHIVVLRYIPPHVAVRPFLMSEIDLYNIRGNTNILKVSFGNKEEASIFIALIVWVSTLMCYWMDKFMSWKFSNNIIIWDLPSTR